MSAPVLRRPVPLTLYSASGRASELRQHEAELDVLDLEIAGLRRQQVTETRETLATLGIDVSGYALPPFPRPIEQRSTRHPDGPTLILRRAQAVTARRRDGPRRLVRVYGEVLSIR